VYTLADRSRGRAQFRIAGGYGGTTRSRQEYEAETQGRYRREQNGACNKSDRWRSPDVLQMADDQGPGRQRAIAATA
jgi:hypothetical protein